MNIIILFCFILFQCACGTAYERNWGIDVPVRHTTVYSAQYPEDTARGDGVFFTVISCSESILDIDIGLNQNWADMTDEVYSQIMGIAEKAKPEKQYIPGSSGAYKFIKLEELENIAYVLFDESTLRLYIIESII